jgi:putative ABC transport system permease protein
MKLFLLIKIALREIEARKFRSLLTVIGISIGVIFIVIIMSLSQGLISSILAILMELGKDVIFILPGKAGSTPRAALASGIEFTESDIEQIKKIPDVKYVFPITYLGSPVKYLKDTEQTFLIGHSRSLMEISGIFNIEKGRYFEDGKYEVILGARYGRTTFGKEIPIGTNLIIKGKKFRVVGILKDRGGIQEDFSIFIPYDKAEELIGRKKILSIFIKINENKNPEEVAEVIKKVLKEKRKVEDFNVITAASVSRTSIGLINLITLFITGLVGISLIVAITATINTILTSVYERVKEIGVLKAIGAKNNDILSLFVIEGLIISIFGGLLGLLIGYLLAVAIDIWANYQGYPIKAKFSYDVVLLVLIISIITGFLSSYLPAKKAAEIKPQEALRYE